MAAVYAATHRNGARAAIKLFPFSVTTSAEFAERILREGYLANKIGHPAVVRVLDDHLDREREYAYLVMELLDGETARQRVERTGPSRPSKLRGT
jgi:serine/threonine protein kinase